MQVLHASCECPGGAPPSCCKHTFAVLTFIQEYCAKELHDAQTEKLQEWHKPSKKKKFSPKKTKEIFKNSASVQNGCENPVNFSALKELSANAPIFSLLKQSDFDYDAHMIDRTIKLPITNVVSFDYKTELKGVELAFDEIVFFKEEVMINIDEAFQIEKNTINQHKNELWHRHRRVRLTASNFHRVYRRKDNFHDLSKSIMNPPDLSRIPAINYGLQKEDSVKYLIKKHFKDFTFRNVGLVINPKYPYLGASPDGLLHSNNETALVEIKCVFNKEKLSLDQLCERRANFCLKRENGQFMLKKEHNYYTQMQGQLAVCGLQNSYFCLSYDSEILYIERIEFCPEFWERCSSVLKNFFFFSYLKCLLNNV